MLHNLLCCVSQPKLFFNKPNDEVLQVLGSNPISRHWLLLGKDTIQKVCSSAGSRGSIVYLKGPLDPKSLYIIIKSCRQSWVSFPDSFDQLHLGREGSMPRDDPNFFGQPDFRPKLPERHHLRWHSRAVLVSTQACICIDWELGDFQRLAGYWQATQ